MYPVAKDFDRVYEYLIYRLRQANLYKDKAMLEEALKHLRTMRNTWEEVIKSAKQKDRA